MMRLQLSVFVVALGSSGCFEALTRGAPEAPVDAGVTCGAGLTVCDNACVSLKLDDSHCGSCTKSCAAADTCAGGACYPRSCTDAECSSSQACVNSACNEKLCVGVICPSDSTCFGGKCLSRACGAQTCDVGFVCQNGACVDPACIGVTCAAGRRCVRGACALETCTDGVRGAAETDLDCGGACPDCSNGKACTSGGDCQSGVCTNRVCVACASTAECAGGKACISGVCEVCTSGSQCGTGQGCRADGTCGPCSAQPQCAAGLACAAGVCGACATNAQCAGGQACLAGACGPCVSNLQCTTGQACVAGVCGPCNSTAQCNSGQACVANVCGQCTLNAHCASGQACVAGTCGPCSTSAQCGTGACINGACSPCTASSQCGIAQACVSSACTACTAISLGNPSSSITNTTAVNYVATYGVLTDTSTIILAPSFITFDAPGITGCTAAISGTGLARTIAVTGCTGTGPVRFSIAPATAATTTTQIVACDVTSATFQLDQTGPDTVSSIVVGTVPQTLTATPTLTYAAATDIGGSTVARYEVQVIRDSDSSIARDWTTHVSGTALTVGIALAANSAYHFNIRGVDALGNLGAQISSSSFTSANALFLTVSANTNKYNLFAAAQAAGWTAGLPIVVTINAGVIVHSDTVATPGFSYGALPTTTPVTINNNGSIHGARGPTSDKATNLAWEGGPALVVSSPTTLVNAGVIVGGVGNGGNGDGDSCGGCGGGNGGSTGGAGGGAIIVNAATTITNTGTIWGGGGGGGSGGGGFNAGFGSINGGSGAGAALLVLQSATGGGGGGGQVGVSGGGGDYGLPGVAGGAGTNGASGASAGGFAIVLNGRTVTFNGNAVTANPSYTPGTWLAGTKGRVAP